MFRILASSFLKRYPYPDIRAFWCYVRCISVLSLSLLPSDYYASQDVAYPLRKNIRPTQLLLFTTFTLHIKLHSELQRRRNDLNVFRCYKSTNLIPLGLVQLLTDLPPLQHEILLFNINMYMCTSEHCTVR